MKYFLMVLMVCFIGAAKAQTTDQIRQQMAKIRQTTNWDDPAAAAKANEEIKKLAGQLTGQPVKTNTSKQNQENKPAIFQIKIPVSKESTIKIAERFFNRSYKALDIVLRTDFDTDFKAAEKEKFNLDAVRKLTTIGATYLTFGSDHNLACVYLASAVKAYPTDTLSVNNFGAYLRGIDSTAISIPVLLYAYELFSGSPVILTQLGNSYFEMNDFAKAESYYKKALEINPDFGQAHTSLCDLYIRQKRLQDAIVELFAGVKGMGCTYRQASNNFSYLKDQAEKSANAGSAKEKFWEETKKQMNPPDALASLVPAYDRLKIPELIHPADVADWTEGGGYISGVQGYNSFHSQLLNFTVEFQQVQNEVPGLPQNAVLRDYPNERFALDCITEYFFRKSDKEADDFRYMADEYLEKAGKLAESYLGKKEVYAKDYVACVKGCGGDGYCLDECLRVFCTKECPSAIQYNKDLQGIYSEYDAQFLTTRDNQKDILDDLYEFSGPWFARIESPYWSKIYAYEIQRVALSIIGNTYTGYIQGFPFVAHNECGTDCSKFANPATRPPEEVDSKKPKGNECPPNRKMEFAIAVCSLGLDCESIEFGCAAGVAVSLKRNFEKKTTTGFLGAGFKGGAGFARAGIQAGMQVTVSDDNQIKDGGFKFDASASGGAGPVQVGATATGSFTVMTGFKSNVDFGVGGEHE